MIWLTSDTHFNMTSRRNFLTGIVGTVICAPAIVRASSLMAVKPWWQGDIKVDGSAQLYRLVSEVRVFNDSAVKVREGWVPFDLNRLEVGRMETVKRGVNGMHRKITLVDDRPHSWTAGAEPVWLTHSRL